jgi:hypothetical protein
VRTSEVDVYHRNTQFQFRTLLLKSKHEIFRGKKRSNVQTQICLLESVGHFLFGIAVCLKKDGYSIMTWDHAIRQLVSVPLGWIMLQGSL